MRVALVSAIYGDYEHPKVLRDDVGVDNAFLFTDSYDVAAEASDYGWEAILDEMPEIASPMLRAKYWKTHPTAWAKEHDISIWIDGSMVITVPEFADRCIDALGDDDVSFTPHPLRDCIYPEAAVTAALARYSDCDPMAQVKFYRDVIGHPKNWGLFASGAFTVRHSDRVARWGKHWWDDCVNWTYQDQLSLPVITRLMTMEGQLRWNKNMPWATWWGIVEHGR